jgi:aquaporin Z
MEGASLGVFMLSACASALLLEHPASPVRGLLPDPFLRRALMGLAMGATAVAIIHSPWGRRSGAHLNPGVTLAFARLGHVGRRDALGYVAGQFAGAALAIGLVSVPFGALLAAPTVRYVVTEPGPAGVIAALFAEAAISFGLVLVVLRTAASPRFAPFTGLAAGVLIALYITFEAPLSGTSMNPARSFASALGAGAWQHLWIYFVAPPLGMQLAAWVHACTDGRGECAKLDHRPGDACHFCGREAAGHAAGGSEANEPEASEAETPREVVAAPAHAARNLAAAAGVSMHEGGGIGSRGAERGGTTQ